MNQVIGEPGNQVNISLYALRVARGMKYLGLRLSAFGLRSQGSSFLVPSV
jgi:hypothetical protein